MIVDSQRIVHTCILAYLEGIDLAFEQRRLLENFEGTSTLIVDHMLHTDIAFLLMSTKLRNCIFF